MEKPKSVMFSGASMMRGRLSGVLLLSASMPKYTKTAPVPSEPLYRGTLTARSAIPSPFTSPRPVTSAANFEPGISSVRTRAGFASRPKLLPRKR